MIELLKRFSGRIGGVVGSKHSGKTTALLQLIEETKQYKTNIVCFFHHREYKEKIKGVEFLSTLNELETVQDSFIFIDEFHELLMLNDRHSIDIVKKFFTQIEHNNNYLIMCGTPEHFNKLVCGAIGNNWLLKSLNYDEIVNGSGLKKFVQRLAGDFVGGTRLNVRIDEILYSGMFYPVNYNKSLDKKSTRKDLFIKKEVFKQC